MTGTADAAAASPALTRSLTMRVMSSVVRTGEGIEEAVIAEAVARSATGVLPEVAEVAAAALEEAEVTMVGRTDNDGFLGGWSDISTTSRPEGGALAPKPVFMGRRETVDGGTRAVTMGGTGQPLEPPGGGELWAWVWEMKTGWTIRSWE